MINVNDLERISDLLSNIFYYGFSHQYSDESIEYKILNSRYISSLENGDGSFLNNDTLEEVVSSVFGAKVEDDELINTNALALWLGYMYTELFFTSNKSFSFIFLYLPIKHAINLFPVYHEMDITQTLDYFSDLVRKENILALLLKKNKMSARQLSSISGISYNTIVNFTRDNEYIYNAKFDSIYKISQILKININTFVRSINNFTNSSMFAFDRQNIKFRSVLGLYIVSFYSSEIYSRDYKYDDSKQCFVFGKKILKVVTTNKTKDNSESLRNPEIERLVKEYMVVVPEIERQNHILVIFEENQISEELKPYLDLIKYNFEKIIIINSFAVLCICEKYWKSYMTDSVNNALLNKAKRDTGGDFAVK